MENKSFEIANHFFGHQLPAAQQETQLKATVFERLAKLLHFQAKPKMYCNRYQSILDALDSENDRRLYQALKVSLAKLVPLSTSPKDKPFLNTVNFLLYGEFRKVFCRNNKSYFKKLEQDLTFELSIAEFIQKLLSDGSCPTHLAPYKPVSLEKELYRCLGLALRNFEKIKATNLLVSIIDKLDLSVSEQAAFATILAKLPTDLDYIMLSVHLHKEFTQTEVHKYKNHFLHLFKKYLGKTKKNLNELDKKEPAEDMLNLLKLLSSIDVNLDFLPSVAQKP